MQSLRILFVVPYVPSRLRPRAYNLIKHLSGKGHRVTVVAACSSREEARAVPALKAQCMRVETVRVPLTRSAWNCLRALPTALPLQAWYSYSPMLERVVRRELRRPAAGRNGDGGETYDVVHIEHLRAVLVGLRATGVPRVYDAVDCISQLFDQTQRLGPTRWSRLRAQLDLQRTRTLEARLAGQFDRVVIASERERRTLLQLSAELHGTDDAAAAARIHVLPLGVDVQHFAPWYGPRDRDRATLIFVGRMSYHANVSAVRFLVDQVLPLVWAQRPDVQLRIVGARPPREVTALARRHGPRVRVTGFVPDVRPYLAQATVSVAPLRYAAGVQNKVLEAMAMAVPVVTTPAGAAGLDIRHGEDALIGGDAAEVAHGVLQLLDDVVVRQRLAEAGRRYVERRHDWRVIVDRLETIYHEAGAQFRGDLPTAPGVDDASATITASSLVADTGTGAAVE